MLGPQTIGTHEMFVQSLTAPDSLFIFVRKPPRTKYTKIKTDGVLHREYWAYQICLASKLATKWQRLCSVVMNWVKLRMQFAVFRAVDLRLRGMRRRILDLGLQDGAAIFAHQH